VRFLMFLGAPRARPALKNTGRAVFLKEWFKVPHDPLILALAANLESAIFPPG
jgi:hypothetical protein